MTAPPANSDEDYYMDESFDEESLSEVEEEAADDVPEESDSHSDSDVEGEFLRGNVSASKVDQPQELIIKEFSLNMPLTIPQPTTHPQPHARRHQIFGKRSGGGSGFPREKMMTYNSSSEDEAQVVIKKTVAEVNQYTERPGQMDDETLSERTLVPNGHTEFEDNEDIEMEDELEEEEDVVYDIDEKDDVAIGKLQDENQPNQNAIPKLGPPQNDLVDIVDCGSDIGTCSGDSETEKGSPQTTDDELEIVPLHKKISMQKGFSNRNEKPNLPTEIENITAVPSLEGGLKGIDGEIIDPHSMGMSPNDTFNVKFLEQQMTQMSEMIMQTFRLSGGSADNNALEQLALATKLMKKQSKKLSELQEESESISTMDSVKTPTTVRSEVLINRSGKCRCPSLTDDNEPEEESCSMDECGQGDGLRRYPSHLRQSQIDHINCRVSSVTPSSFNSDNSRYHIDIRRPQSTTSTEKVNYKNLGRKSFSFTNPQVREIERQNNILLKKMMNVKPTIKASVPSVKSSSNLQAKNQPPPRLTSAAVNRKKYQRQIDLDNDVLKRKLEAVGSRRPLFK